VAGTPNGGPPDETPDLFGAYPRLDPQQIDALARRGRRQTTNVGDVLFHAGETTYDFVVVLEGRVAVTQDDGGSERLIGVHGPGRFLGELNLITGEAVFLTATVVEAGSVLVVPVDRIREIVAGDPVLGDLILRAYLIRRSLLIGLRAGIRIIGSRYDPNTRRLRDFAARNRLPHRWVDLEDDPAAEQLLRQLGVAPDETPIVIWSGEQVLRNPSNAELARVTGLLQADLPHDLCDLLIVGLGPAGLAAAVYAASEGLDTVAVDGVATGGQAATTSRIENYLGFPSGISGAELADRATIQARKFAARISVPAGAASLEHRDGHYVVGLEDGTEVVGRAVVLATGARYRTLDVPGLDRFEGVSVYYAATLAEADMCRGDPVVIVGGGNSAGQAAVFLSEHVPAVRLIVRNADLDTDMSRYLADQVERIPTIEVLLSTEVVEAVGSDLLEAVIVADNRTGDRRVVPARALFVFIGTTPCTSWLGDLLALDERGYILTGADVGDGVEATTGDVHVPYELETSRPGVFAVGDVRAGAVSRVASAIGDGAMAVRFVHRHLAAQQRPVEGTHAHARSAAR
jgi:thioredoxin reductase (NADPH)